MTNSKSFDIGKSDAKLNNLGFVHWEIENSIHYSMYDGKQSDIRKIKVLKELGNALELDIDVSDGKGYFEKDRQVVDNNDGSQEYLDGYDVGFDDAIDLVRTAIESLRKAYVDKDRYHNVKVLDDFRELLNSSLNYTPMTDEEYEEYLRLDEAMWGI